MSLKKIKTIGIFGIFVLCFLTHFGYTWFPNFLFSLFFPVNESIWEHMKMIVSAIIIWEVIEYYILNIFDINYNNFLLGCFIMCFFSICVFLIIYYPISNFAGDSFVLILICLFITIYYATTIGYLVMELNPIKYEFLLGFLGIVLIYMLFGIFTYYPLKLPIFLDPRDNYYGINNNII